MVSPLPPLFTQHHTLGLYCYTYYVRKLANEQNCVNENKNPEGKCLIPCPVDYTPRGNLCISNKNGVFRTDMGPPTACPSGLEKSMGYCYRKCTPGSTPVGRFCLNAKCPKKYPYSYIDKLCLKNEAIANEISKTRVVLNDVGFSFE